MDNQNIQIETVPAHKVGDIELATRALNVLKCHYPGYMWRVGINDEQLGGVMYIMNLTINAELFSNTPYGYVLFLSTIYGDQNLDCVMRAGGEILERARLSRGKNRNEDVKKVDGVRDIHQPINKEPI